MSGRHTPRRSRPDRGTVSLALAVMRAAAGCICEPELTVRHVEGLTYHTIHHDDDWCPAVNHSIAIAPSRKARR